MRFYTASKLGPKRALTPEGFLVCLDVPIARTGEMLYGPDEIDGLIPGPDGLVHVQRDPEEVFKPESMASFLGKPTTNDHPPVLVTPATYRTYVTGSAQNIRRGEGMQADLLLADLIFAEPGAIKAILDGKDEISNGYDADYEQIAPGRARQINIVGNHVALVDEGRCGSRCAIGDSAGALQSTIAADAITQGSAAGIALRNAAGELLFLKRRAGAPHGGTWCFPGGSMEEGESPEQTARRELAEETGLKAGSLRLVDNCKLDEASGRTFSTFAGEVNGPIDPKLNDEHDAFRWASASEPPKPLHPGVAATLRDKRSALATTDSPRVDPAPAPNEAPSCRCGGGHHRDAIPADQQRTPYMPKVKRSAFDRLRAAFATKDEKAFEQEVSKVQDDVEELQEASEQSETEKKLADMITAAVGVAVKPICERIDAIEAKVTATPTADEDDTPEAKAAKAAEEAKAVAEAAAAAAATAAAAAAAVGGEDEVTEDDAPSDMGSGGEAGGGSTAGSAGNNAVEAADLIDSKMTADAAGLAVSFRDAIARAEILAPGIKLPTYDGKKTKKTVADSICALRREALKRAFASDDRKAHVAPFVTDAAPEFAKLSCGAVKLMFTGASELAKAANSRSTRTSDAASRDTTLRGSIADMNKANRDFWNLSKK